MKPWLKLLNAAIIFGSVLLTIQAADLDIKYLAVPTSLFMVLASLSAFSGQYCPFRVWNAIGLSSTLAGAAVWVLNPAAVFDVLIFSSGIFPAWLLGIGVLSRLLKYDNFGYSPFDYRAMAETHPRLSLLLFFSFLGLVGFPISPAFPGEDLLLSHATGHDPWFALPITIAFVINGIAAARVFQRLCMGRPSELNANAVAAEYIVTRERYSNEAPDARTA